MDNFFKNVDNPKKVLITLYLKVSRIYLKVSHLKEKRHKRSILKFPGSILKFPSILSKQHVNTNDLKKYTTCLKKNILKKTN